MAVVEIGRNSLKRALSISRLTLPNKKVSHVAHKMTLINFMGDVVEIWSTDGSKGSSSILKNTGDHLTEKVLVDPQAVERVLAKSEDKDQPVRFEVDTKKGCLKIFVKSGSKSSVSVKYMQHDRLVPFNPLVISEPEKIDREKTISGLTFCAGFVPDMNDNMRQADYVVMHKGLIRALNGSSRQGYIIDKSMDSMPRIVAHKKHLECITKVLKAMVSDQVDVSVSDDNLSFFDSIDGESFRLTVLKSDVELIPARKEYMTPEGPYVTIDKNDLIKMVDRIVLSDDTAATEAIPACIRVSAGSASELTMELMNDSTPAIDSIVVQRFGDNNDEEIEVGVDLRSIKIMLKAMGSPDEFRLYICDSKLRYFRMLGLSNNGSGGKRVEIAVCAYGRVVAK